MGNSSDTRWQDPARFKGMEIFEVRPVILGGSPTDPRNKTALTRKQHIEAVRYWNRIISDMRRKEG
jgi:hypothetical protein